MEKMPNFIDKNALTCKKMQLINKLIKEAVFVALVQLLVYSPTQAQRHHKKPEPTPLPIQFSNEEILKNSQVSYRAEGGFSDVISYGIIISCVDGKISVFKSIHDPKLVDEDHKRFELGSMTHEKYIALWKKLANMNVFIAKDVPDPKEDILEEFTYSFHVKIGKKENQFNVYGIQRPAASHLFAFKSLIDKSADMESFWNSGERVVQNPAK